MKCETLVTSELKLLGTAIKTLAADGKLPFEYKPHQLDNNYDGYWECHF